MAFNALSVNKFFEMESKDKISNNKWNHQHVGIQPVPKPSKDSTSQKCISIDCCRPGEPECQVKSKTRTCVNSMTAHVVYLQS